MITALNNRIYTTSGECLYSLDELEEYNKKNPIEVLSFSLASLDFKVEEHIIYAVINGESMPFTTMGFKTLCQILKIPYGFLNKLLDDDLLIENLKSSPMRVDENVNIYMRDIEGNRYITAVNVDEALTSNDMIELLKRTCIDSNNTAALQEITVSNENVCFYYLQPQESYFDLSAEIARGFVIVSGEGVSQDFQIRSFYEFSDGNRFQFSNPKALKKVSRKEKSFKIMVEDELRHFNLNDHLNHYDTVLRQITGAVMSSEVSFSLLKQFKSAIQSTYSFQAGVYETSLLLDHVLPEFDVFKDAYKEELKQLPLFDQNNIVSPLDVGKTLALYQNEILALESPLFIDRMHKKTYALLFKVAEKYYAGRVD